MPHRRNEISPRGIDRGWPHQVEIDGTGGLGNRYDEVHHFAASLGAAPRGGRSRYDEGKQYIRLAFATADAADKFQDRFGGRRLTVSKVSGRWRDDYLPVPIDVPEYFRLLTARIPSAVVVPCRRFVYSVPNDCHGNARRYVMASGGQAVRGWLVNAAQANAPFFMLHTVVAIGGGLVDVTLTEEERGGLRFLLHEGTADMNARGVVEQIEWLHRRVGGGWICPAALESLNASAGGPRRTAVA